MKWDRTGWVSRAAGTALLLLAVACGDTDQLVQPPTSTLYTTPTGLVTANPPEIFVGAGDIAGCSTNGDEATAQILDTVPGTVFLAGDDVYENGTLSEFNNCYGPTWGRHKARTKPSAGNHEYNTSGASGYFSYFGAAAGDPSKGYYSYDLGAWHIIVLNSNITRSAGSPQDNWLRADLAAHPNRCTAAYFHHPLYGSDGGSGTGGRVSTSQYAMYKSLYDGGADIVLVGHRHFYERLKPGTPDGTADPNGIRTFIVGMGGIGGISGITNIHPLSEARNGDTRGVLKLYLYEDSYAWRFIHQAGKTFTDTGSTACSGGSTGGGGGSSVSGSQSGVSASPTSIMASSGGTTSLITVTARDANGNPVSGVPVVLAATGSGNTLTQPAGTTNANGVASGTLSSTDAGIKTISATADGVAISQTATVTVTTDPNAPLAVDRRVAAGADDAEESATGTVSLSSSDLELVNDGNDQTVGMRFSAVAIPAGATISNAYVQFQVDEAGSLATSLTIRGQATGNAATFTTATRSISSRTTTSSAVSWAPAAWATIGQAGVDQRTPNIAPVIQEIVNGSGWASGNALAIIIRGTGKRTAVAYDGTASAAPLLHVEYSTGPAVSSSQSGVSVSPATITASTGTSLSTVTVTVRDASGNPLSGATVALSATGSGNTLTQPAGPTNASGVATGTLSSTVTGAKTVSATANGVALTQTATVNVTAAAATALAFTAQPTSTVAGAVITPAVQVEIRDQFGNRVTTASTSVDVAIATNPGGGTLSGTTPVAAESGVATFTDLSISSAGTGYALGATAAGLTGAASVAFNVTGVPSASLSTVTASPSSIAAGSGSAVITVTARDAGGNPISGATVVLTATGTGNTLTQPGSATNANGVATGAVSSTDAGDKTVSAIINGVAITQTATVTVTAAPLVVERRVAGGSDDAEESATGGMYLTSSDLELVNDGSNQTVGMRFTGVAIPAGAIISNAYVQFQVDETGSTATSLTIRGQATGNAATFTTASRDVSSRNSTANAVTWAPVAWATLGQAGTDQRTPNLTPVIQEIVNGSGWASGNALVIIITGTGKRTAKSYEGQAAAAPLLHVEYSTPPTP